MHHCLKNACGFSAALKVDLVKHYVVVHRRILCSFDSCVVDFKERKNANSHYRFNHLGDVVVCLGCARTFKHRGTYFGHKAVCVGSVVGYRIVRGDDDRDVGAQNVAVRQVSAVVAEPSDDANVSNAVQVPVKVVGVLRPVPSLLKLACEAYAALSSPNFIASACAFVSERFYCYDAVDKAVGTAGECVVGFFYMCVRLCLMCLFVCIFIQMIPLLFLMSSDQCQCVVHDLQVVFFCDKSCLFFVHSLFLFCSFF